MQRNKIASYVILITSPFEKLVFAMLLIGSVITCHALTHKLDSVVTYRFPSTAGPIPRPSLSKETTREVEQLLSNLGYWTGPVDGVFDIASRHALIAFQKAENRRVTGRLTLGELQSLRTAKRLLPQDSRFSHIEIDLTRQILFSVDETGLVSKILPVSTGSDKLFTSEGRTRRAVTPCGRFTIIWKIPGWRKSPLGMLYYPNYVTGGVAIHGNPSVPFYPASHGCIRIPMFASKQFSEMNPIGTVVIIYNSDVD